MRRMRALIARFAGLFHHAPADRELDEELQSHLQMQTEDNVRLGMTSGEARRQALIRLGSVESAKESYRDRRGIPPVEHVVQDIRFGRGNFLAQLSIYLSKQTSGSLGG